MYIDILRWSINMCNNISFNIKILKEDDSIPNYILSYISSNNLFKKINKFKNIFLPIYPLFGKHTLK